MRGKAQIQGKRSRGHHGVNLIKDFKNTVLIFVFPACHKILGTELVLKKYLILYRKSLLSFNMHKNVLGGEYSLYLFCIIIIVPEKAKSGKTEAK